MSGNRIRDDAAPWSFFLPVLLAVIVGVLVAGWIQWAIGMAFEGRERAARLSGPVTPAPAIEAQAEPADLPVEESTEAASDADLVGDFQSTVSSPEPSAAQGQSPPVDTPPDAGTTAMPPPELPGAIVARRDGAPAACINGTVALRDANGWQQQLENDAPVACTEQSTAPRP